MSSASAQFLRFVLPQDVTDDLVREAKSMTYEHYSEIALVRIESGRLALVRGGRYGIDFELRSSTSDEQPTVWLEIEGVAYRVTELLFHTHPLATGPSDSDCAILDLLGQEHSMLYELFGGGRGTIFRRKSRGEAS